MENRSIWTVKPESDCWEKLGKAPVSVRWVDTLRVMVQEFDLAQDLS